MNLDVTPTETPKRWYKCRTRTRDAEMHGERLHTDGRREYSLGVGRLGRRGEEGDVVRKREIKA